MEDIILYWRLTSYHPQLTLEQRDFFKFHEHLTLPLSIPFTVAVSLVISGLGCFVLFELLRREKSNYYFSEYCNKCNTYFYKSHPQ